MTKLGARIHFHYTSATITSIIAAAIAVAVSFGAHLTKANTHSILVLVGLVGALFITGGGVKSGALAASGIPAGARFHFTPASIVAILAAAAAVAVSFGLKMTQGNINSILTLVGLLAGGVTLGGGFKSAGLLLGGVHPARVAAHRRTTVKQHPPEQGPAR